MAKVFVVDDVQIVSPSETIFSQETTNYWGTDAPLTFLIHISEIEKLMNKRGYLGVRVVDIEDAKEVRVRWLSFGINQKAEFEAKDTNDYFYFLRDNAVKKILGAVFDEENPKVLALRLLKNNAGNYQGFFSAGVFVESGIGTGTPGAGAKVP